MNPGYAGRTKIPADSKFPLEWIVPMKIPNVSNILHIMLATKGFYNAKALGIKLASCLNNLKETGKGENKNHDMHHLDFGLRAAK
jgi:hypothetical protein